MIEDVVAFHTELDVAAAFAREADVFRDDDVGVEETGAVVGGCGECCRRSRRVHRRKRRWVRWRWFRRRRSSSIRRVDRGCGGCRRWRGGDLLGDVRASVVGGVGGAPEGVGSAVTAISDVKWEAGGEGGDTADLPAGAEEVARRERVPSDFERDFVDGREYEAVAGVVLGVAVVELGVVLVVAACTAFAKARVFEAGAVIERVGSRCRRPG